MQQDNWMDWYESLVKPSWTPEPSTIGLIWTILYPIIVVTFAYVFYEVLRGRAPKSIGWVYLIILIANLLFTPIQFGLQNLVLASLDILIVLVSIVVMIYQTWTIHRWVSCCQIPYFVWVAIASSLQLSITRKHRGSSAAQGFKTELSREGREG